MDRRNFLKIAGLTAIATAIGCDNNGRRLVSAPALQVSQVNPGPCRIVVFGSDSLKIDYARLLIQREAPAISSLNSPIMSLSGGLSVTQPGWASIWTGLPSWYTKALSNATYKALPDNMHIMEKFMTNFAGQDFFPVWLTGKNEQIKGNKPPSVRPNGMIDGSPHYALNRLINSEGYLGIYHGDRRRYTPETLELGLAAVKEARQHDSFCCFIHFADPDSTGHTAKAFEPYMEAAMAVDYAIWEIMGELPDDTKIIYCSDHGFNFVELGDSKGGHKYAPEGMLATNFETFSYPVVCQNSIGRLIYKVAGFDPDRAVYSEEERPYKMYGTDLI